MLSLWTRPTIPFKLECEKPNIKQEIVSEIQKTTLDINGDTSIAYTAIAATNLILFFLGISNCCLLCCSAKLATDGKDA